MPAILPRVLVFLKSEDGPTAVEYGIMLALMIVVMMSAITALGNSAASVWLSDSQHLKGAMS
ncbi:MAG: Flp family type IVb pilin [Isosphaeraceae bacterium]|nr:Flp family type IVb pilin [Isosphaeraceae bacterium]